MPLRRSAPHRRTPGSTLSPRPAGHRADRDRELAGDDAEPDHARPGGRPRETRLRPAQDESTGCIGNRDIAAHDREHHLRAAIRRCGRAVPLHRGLRRHRQRDRRALRTVDSGCARTQRAELEEPHLSRAGARAGRLIVAGAEAQRAGRARSGHARSNRRSPHRRRRRHDQRHRAGARRLDTGRLVGERSRPFQPHLSRPVDHDPARQRSRVRPRSARSRAPRPPRRARPRTIRQPRHPPHRRSSR